MIQRCDAQDVLDQIHQGDYKRTANKGYRTLGNCITESIEFNYSRKSWGKGGRDAYKKYVHDNKETLNALILKHKGYDTRYKRMIFVGSQISFFEASRNAAKLFICSVLASDECASEELESLAVDIVCCMLGVEVNE